ncbi:MAG: hypothetical protein ABI354_03260 [Candidatus Saccharimonadales bacterium]
MNWTWIILAASVVVIVFGFVVAFGAPYVPTLKSQRESALDLFDFEAGQTLVELGCGDGSMVLAAAKRGLKVYGYELNPVLLLITYARTFKYRKHVILTLGNFWNGVWPRTDGIYVFLLDRYMIKLNKKIIHNYPSQKIKLVSYAFRVPDRKHISENNGMYLYEYKPSTDS